MSTTRETPFSMALSWEQRQLQDLVRQFCSDHITPAVIRHYDETETYPWPILEAAHACGLYSLDTIGGAALDPTGLSLPLMATEFARADASITLALLGGPILAAFNVNALGTPAQKAEWLPQCFERHGKPVQACFGSTEPDAGSNPREMKARAIFNKLSQKWVITGRKAFITSGGIAYVNVIVAWAQLDEGSPAVLATFIVPWGTEGLSQGQKHQKMGFRASHTAELVLDQVRIPAQNVIGGMEKLQERVEKAAAGKGSGGAQAALMTFGESRPLVGAVAVGIARHAIDIATDYSRTRRQGGRPIGQYQAVRHTIADMAMEADAAELLVWRACWMLATKQKLTRAEGSQAKLFASRMSVRVTQQAIEILAGMGYMRDSIVEQLHRDALLTLIFEGTSFIQSDIIGSAVTGLPVLQ